MKDQTRQELEFLECYIKETIRFLYFVVTCCILTTILQYTAEFWIFPTRKIGIKYRIIVLVMHGVLIIGSYWDIRRARNKLQEARIKAIVDSL